MVPVAPAVQAEVRVPVMVPASIQDTAVPASSPDAEVAEIAEGVPLAVVAGIPPVASPPVSDRDARALTALIRQIEQQARVRGIEPPVVTTRQEAQAALQRLLRHV